MSNKQRIVEFLIIQTSSISVCRCSGYSLRHWLPTRFPNPHSAQEICFNIARTHSPWVSEHAIALHKGQNQNHQNASGSTFILGTFRCPPLNGSHFQLLKTPLWEPPLHLPFLTVECDVELYRDWNTSYSFSATTPSLQSYTFTLSFSPHREQLEHDRCY